MSIAAPLLRRTRLPRVPIGVPGAAPRVAAAWLAATLIGFALVLYGIGPSMQDRGQRRLLVDHASEIERAAAAAGGLSFGATAPQTPELGDPVGILEIGGVALQQVVLEGAASSQTRRGPGHVPGTAGLGQPGNAAVVGRRGAFGGPFRDLGSVEPGDQIVVSTVQGQSVYEVLANERVRVVPESGDEELDLYADPAADAKGAIPALTTDELFGPTRRNQLTLVTSSSWAPWNQSDGRVVVAELVSEPFAPTPQGGRSRQQTGMVGERVAVAPALLVVTVYGTVLGGAAVLYRRLSLRTAYLLTAAPLLAGTVIAGETLSRLLPAWL